MTVKTVLSPSALNIMIHKCRRCFWLTQNKVWKRPSDGFPQITNGMDNVLKKYFDSFIPSGKLPPELSSDSRFNGMKLFDDVVLLEKYREWWNKDGLRFEDVSLNSTLRGAIDELLMKGDEIVVFDYKTKGYEPDDEKKAEGREWNRYQMNFYNLLLKKNGYEIYDYAYLGYYWPDGVNDDGSVRFGKFIDEVPVDIKMAEDLWKEAVLLVNSSCPSDGVDIQAVKKNKKDTECKWCKFVSYP